MRKLIKGTIEMLCMAAMGFAFAYMILNGMAFELYGM